MNTQIPLIDQIPAQQALFVHHLRTNPNNVTQITGSLVDDQSHMCAVGLGIECFGLLRQFKKTRNEEREARKTGNWSFTPAWDVEEEIAERLQIPKDHVTSIYQLNDDHGLSFSEIADILEEYFLEVKKYGTGSSGSPEDVYDNRKEREAEASKGAFVEVWEAHQKRLQNAMDEVAKSLNEQLKTLPVSVYTVFVDEDFLNASADDAWYDHVDW